MATQNPNWTRDELILALDFYQQHGPLSKLRKDDPALIELSELLNSMGGTNRSTDTYRNPNGVYMKLGNLARFDPEYQGAGLSRGNKLVVPA